MSDDEEEVASFRDLASIFENSIVSHASLRSRDVDHDPTTSYAEIRVLCRNLKWSLSGTKLSDAVNRTKVLNNGYISWEEFLQLCLPFMTKLERKFIAKRNNAISLTDSIPADGGEDSDEGSTLTPPKKSITPADAKKKHFNDDDSIESIPDMDDVEEKPSYPKKTDYSLNVKATEDNTRANSYRSQHHTSAPAARSSGPRLLDDDEGSEDEDELVPKHRHVVHNTSTAHRGNAAGGGGGSGSKPVLSKLDESITSLSELHDPTSNLLDDSMASQHDDHRHHQQEGKRDHKHDAEAKTMYWGPRRDASSPFGGTSTAATAGSKRASGKPSANAKNVRYQDQQEEEEEQEAEEMEPGDTSAIRKQRFSSWDDDEEEEEVVPARRSGAGAGAGGAPQRAYNKDPLKSINSKGMLRSASRDEEEESDQEEEEVEDGGIPTLGEEEDDNIQQLLREGSGGASRNVKRAPIVTRRANNMFSLTAVDQSKESDATFSTDNSKSNVTTPAASPVKAVTAMRLNMARTLSASKEADAKPSPRTTPAAGAVSIPAPILISPTSASEDNQQTPTAASDVTQMMDSVSLDSPTAAEDRLSLQLNPSSAAIPATLQQQHQSRNNAAAGEEQEDPAASAMQPTKSKSWKLGFGMGKMASKLMKGLKGKKSTKDMSGGGGADANTSQLTEGSHPSSLPSDITLLTDASDGEIDSERNSRSASNAPLPVVVKPSASASATAGTAVDPPVPMSIAPPPVVTTRSTSVAQVPAPQQPAVKAPPVVELQQKAEPKPAAVSMPAARAPSPQLLPAAAAAVSTADISTPPEQAPSRQSSTDSTPVAAANSQDAEEATADDASAAAAATGIATKKKSSFSKLGSILTFGSKSKSVTIDTKAPSILQSSVQSTGSVASAVQRPVRSSSPSLQPQQQQRSVSSSGLVDVFHTLQQQHQQASTTSVNTQSSGGIDPAIAALQLQLQQLQLQQQQQMALHQSMMSDGSYLDYGPAQLSPSELPRMESLSAANLERPPLDKGFSRHSKKFSQHNHNAKAASRPPIPADPHAHYSQQQQKEQQQGLDSSVIHLSMVSEEELRYITEHPGAAAGAGDHSMLTKLRRNHSASAAASVSEEDSAISKEYLDKLKLYANSALDEVVVTSRTQAKLSRALSHQQSIHSSTSAGGGLANPKFSADVYGMAAGRARSNSNSSEISNSSTAHMAVTSPKDTFPSELDLAMGVKHRGFLMKRSKRGMWITRYFVLLVDPRVNPNLFAVDTSLMSSSFSPPKYCYFLQEYDTAIASEWGMVPLTHKRTYATHNITSIITESQAKYKGKEFHMHLHAESGGEDEDEGEGGAAGTSAPTTPGTPGMFSFSRSRRNSTGNDSNAGDETGSVDLASPAGTTTSAAVAAPPGLTLVSFKASSSDERLAWITAITAVENSVGHKIFVNTE